VNTAIPESTNIVTISTVTPSNGGLFKNNPVIASYTFPSNERIPQKVTSELNFIITKITKVLDKKAG